jgi:hypothetical protein
MIPSERKVALHHTPQHGDHLSRAVTATQSRHEDKHLFFGATSLDSCQGQSVKGASNSHMENPADRLPEDTLVILYSTRVERKSSHLHMYGVLVLLKTRIVRHLYDVLINEEVRNMLCKSGLKKDLEGWSKGSFYTFDYGGFEYWVVTAKTDCKRLLDGEDVAFEKCSFWVRDKFAHVVYPATMTRKRGRKRKQPLTKDVLPDSIPSLHSK